MNSQASSISLKNAEAASKWCDFLMEHAKRIYQIAAMTEFDLAREILKKIEENKIGNGFTARDIYKNH